MHYQPARAIDETYREPHNKISNFLQSELVKEIFPEFNPPNPPPRQYDQPGIPRPSMGGINTPRMEMNSVHNFPRNLSQPRFTPRPQDLPMPSAGSNHFPAPSNLSDKLIMENQQMMNRINQLEEEMKNPIPKKSKNRK